jgi:heptaprenyl diphosphate synthase
MRIGIANLPILLAADLLPLPWYIALALVKVFGMSLISGSLFTYVALFSLAGTLTAALVMWLARKGLGHHVSAVGVSILGAVASNAAQMGPSLLVYGVAAVRLMAPPFLATGLITGALLGVFVELFVAESRWYARARGASR